MLSKSAILPNWNDAPTMDPFTPVIEEVRQEFNNRKLAMLRSSFAVLEPDRHFLIWIQCTIISKQTGSMIILMTVPQ